MMWLWKFIKFIVYLSFAVYVWYYLAVHYVLSKIVGKKVMFWGAFVKWTLIIVLALLHGRGIDGLSVFEGNLAFSAVVFALVSYETGHLIYFVAHKPDSISEYKLPFTFTNSTRKNHGLDFEHEVARKLSGKGFNRINVTKGSGDFGADIIAYKGFEKYAIQCKCYSSPVGVKAVQEVIAGKSYYDCDRAMVITNSTFTPSAVELAKKSRVELWSDFGTDDFAWIDCIEDVSAMLED